MGPIYHHTVLIEYTTSDYMKDQNRGSQLLRIEPELLAQVAKSSRDNKPMTTDQPPALTITSHPLHTKQPLYFSLLSSYCYLLEQPFGSCFNATIYNNEIHSFCSDVSHYFESIQV